MEDGKQEKRKRQQQKARQQQKSGKNGILRPITVHKK